MVDSDIKANLYVLGVLLLLLFDYFSFESNLFHPFEM